MKTFELRDKEGHLYAFEVNNVLLGRRGLLRVVRTIPGVRITFDRRSSFTRDHR
jgi:hypothetical protein